MSKGYVLMLGSGSSTDDWDDSALAVYIDKGRAERIAERLNKAWKWHHARAKNSYSGPYLESYYIQEVRIR